MQEAEPVPKVIDFGVAKALHERLTERPMHTEVGQLLGTLEYMSPEQADLRNWDVDTRADVYALGVLLYVLLVGSTPLDASALRSAPLTETIRLIREVDPPKPSARLAQSGESLAGIAAGRHSDPARLVREVRGELDWIVMKALEKDRTRRYETASALARDVERYLQHQPVEAGPPSARYRLGKLLRRHRTAALTAAAGLVLLVAGAAVSTWQAVRATQAERTAAAVSAFLQNDLLGQADLANQTGEGAGRDPDLTVRTLLDRAAQTIEGKFNEEPLTEAAIRLTIGKAYRALGQYPEGQRQLERSVALYAAELGAGPPRDPRQQEQPGVPVRRAGEVRPRRAALRRGGEWPDGASGRAPPRHPRSARTTWRRCTGPRRSTSRPSRSISRSFKPTPRRSAPSTPKPCGPRPTSRRSTGTRSGTTRREPLYEEVVRAQTRTLGADHPDTLVSKNGLAVGLPGGDALRRGRGAASRKSWRPGRLKLGADHPDTLTTRNNLALLYQARKQYDLAEALFREVVEGSRRKLGEAHPDTQQRARNLALCYEESGHKEPTRAAR